MHPYAYHPIIIRRGCGWFSHILALGVGYWFGKKCLEHPPEALAEREKFHKYAEEFRRKMLSANFDYTHNPPTLIEHKSAEAINAGNCPTCSHPIVPPKDQ